VAWVIAVAGTVFALSIAPLAWTCSNDGSHHALALSLSEGRVALGDKAGLATNDNAKPDGVIYIDRAPGVAFQLAPLVWLGLDPRLLSAAAFGGTLAILYAWLRRDTGSQLVAGAMVAVASTTLLLRYAPVLFAHSLAAFLLTLSGWLVTAPTRRHGWLIGLALGWLGITEYGLAPLAIAAALVAWRFWPSFYLGAALPVVAAGLYHWAAFGAPWYTGYAFHGSFQAAQSVGGSFDGPLLPGLEAFVWQGKDHWKFDNNGLLFISPVLALWPLGVFVMAKRSRWQAALLASVCLVYLLVYSKHVAFGAGTKDSRYYVPFLPLVLVPIGSLLARFGWPAFVVVGGLAALGVTNLLPHMRGSYGFHGSVALHSPAPLSSHVQIARIHEKRKDPSRAAAEYELALRDAPWFSPEARGSLGLIRLGQGRGDEAFDLLTAAIEEEPDDSRWYVGLGTVLLQRGEWARAAVQLRRAIELGADSAQVHNNLGVALAQQGQYAEAAVQFEETLAREPDHASAKRSLEYVRAQLGAAR
jgi:tetratricopeptide (TPR) repeat protein